MKAWLKIVAMGAAAWAGVTLADWTDARCDIYPRGEDKASAMIPCTFGQRQGYVTITREDGVTHELSPTGDVSGNFRDQHAAWCTGRVVSATRAWSSASSIACGPWVVRTPEPVARS